RNDPIDLVSRIGDPMIPSVAGIASGAISQKTRVMLAGGTQMTAVLCLLKAMKIPLDGICIGTTSYVKNDKSSDILKLVRSICDNVPILSVELGLEFSIKKGLRMYNSGIAKEGVGAGGAAITSILKSKGNLDPTSLLHSIEIEYEISIESQRIGSLQNS
ncbi:MAG: phosphoribosyltransferase, partial [Nitrososphaeraceae archaeon]